LLNDARAVGCPAALPLIATLGSDLTTS